MQNLFRPAYLCLSIPTKAARAQCRKFVFSCAQIYQFFVKDAQVSEFKPEIWPGFLEDRSGAEDSEGQ